MLNSFMLRNFFHCSYNRRLKYFYDARIEAWTLAEPAVHEGGHFDLLWSVSTPDRPDSILPPQPHSYFQGKFSFHEKCCYSLKNRVYATGKCVLGPEVVIQWIKQSRSQVTWERASKNL